MCTVEEKPVCRAPVHLSDMATTQRMVKILEAPLILEDATRQFRGL
jgi:hypothetical protein